tara:strand:+ start:2577 stop:3620 length:1044 start_codon:yes stop_codon:yes gene_type:complete
MNTKFTIEAWVQLIDLPTVRKSSRCVIQKEEISLHLLGSESQLILTAGECQCIGPKITNSSQQPWICLHITSDSNQIKLYVNAIECARIENGQAVFTLEELDVEVTRGDLPTVIPANHTAWRETRKSLFIENTTQRTGRTPLNTVEQFEQLKNRALALRGFIQSVNSGQTHHIEDIVGNLRSLLFYKLKSNQTEIIPSYNPLLLRAAAISDSPLPIYRNKSNCSFEELIQEKITPSATWAFDRFPSVFPTSTQYVEDDLQAFLNSHFLCYEENFYTPLELIQQIANTESSSHFDPEVIPHIQVLKSSPEFFGSTVFITTIKELAEITYYFAERLVENWRTKGYDTRT